MMYKANSLIHKTGNAFWGQNVLLLYHSSVILQPFYWAIFFSAQSDSIPICKCRFSLTSASTSTLKHLQKLLSPDEVRVCYAHEKLWMSCKPLKPFFGLLWKFCLPLLLLVQAAMERLLPSQNQVHSIVALKNTFINVLMNT